MLTNHLSTAVHKRAATDTAVNIRNSGTQIITVILLYEAYLHTLALGYTCFKAIFRKESAHLLFGHSAYGENGASEDILSEPAKEIALVLELISALLHKQAFSPFRNLRIMSGSNPVTGQSVGPLRQQTELESRITSHTWIGSQSGQPPLNERHCDITVKFITDIRYMMLHAESRGSLSRLCDVARFPIAVMHAERMVQKRYADNFVPLLLQQETRCGTVNATAHPNQNPLVHIIGLPMFKGNQLLSNFVAKSGQNNMAELKTPTELGTEHIGKLLVRYALPAITAMVASSLYNIVDRAFIGHGVDSLALSGLAVTFPLMNLSAALGSMVGVGSGTMISLKLGQRDNKSALMLFGNSITLNILIGVIFGALSLLFINPILTLFGATETTIGYARDYMVIILLGNAFTHLYLGINCIIRSAGHPEKAMIATIGTVLLNTLLDYLFVMVFHWGIRGAAIATVISQITAFVWQCIQLSDPNELIHLQRGTFRLKWDLVGNMLTIGLSPCIMNAASCIVVLIINRSLLAYGGDLAIGAYSIVNSIAFIFIMIVMGINQAMQPIAGYNFGARQFGRVVQVLKISIFFATVITTVGFLIGELMPNLCIRIFTNDTALTEIARNGMKKTFLVYPLIGFQMVTGNFFQSIGMPGKSILMSLSRQVLILIPCLLILPGYLGIDGVWYSLPLSDAISVILAAGLLIAQMRHFKNMSKQMPQ